MKKELIICIIIVSIVIIGNIVTQRNTETYLKEMETQLTELKIEIEKQSSQEKVYGKIKEIKNKWDDMQETLAYYIEHDELEKVETQIFLLKGDIEAKIYEDTFAEIEKCIFILEHITDKTALNIKNIF